MKKLEEGFFGELCSTVLKNADKNRERLIQ